MKLRLICSLVLSLLLAFSRVSAQNHASAIRTQAMDMANSLINNKFETFVRYMHPAIIEMAGGKENMQTKMDSAYRTMKRFNVRFKRYWIGKPSEVLEYKNTLQSVIPQITIMNTPLGEVFAESAMIVISEDKGKNWWFIDTNAYDMEKIKTALPDLSPDLVVPPRKKPVITRKFPNNEN